MPAIITDYQSGYSRAGQAVGGAVAQAGQAMGEAIARGPQEAREKELYDIKMDEFNKSKSYRIKHIDNVKQEVLDYLDNSGYELLPRETERLTKKFEDLKDAPAEVAEKKLVDISKNMMGFSVANDSIQNFGDEKLTALYKKSLPFHPDYIFDQPDFGEYSKQKSDSAMKNWKQAKVNDWYNEYTSTLPEGAKPSFEGASGYIAKKQSEDPALKNQELNLPELIKNSLQSEKDIAEEEYKGRMATVAEKNAATSKTRAGQQGEKLRDDSPMGIYKATVTEVKMAESKIDKLKSQLKGKEKLLLSQKDIDKIEGEIVSAETELHIKKDAMNEAKKRVPNFQKVMEKTEQPTRGTIQAEEEKPRFEIVN